MKAGIHLQRLSINDDSLTEETFGQEKTDDDDSMPGLRK